jgi:hypothetical protein
MSERFDELGGLKSAYQDADPDSFGLYLGAGINLPTEEVQNQPHQTYSWKQLLEALHEKRKTHLGTSFEALWEKHGDDWLGLASELIGKEDDATLAKWLDQIIYEGVSPEYEKIPRGDEDGRLAKSVFDQAPTLRAAVCFSSKIRRQTDTSWTFQRNPKIGIVITPNYDFFFGAGWTCYQAFRRQWRLHTPFSQSKPTASQRTINYIHGYLPYRPRPGKKEIVLTEESYDKAYASTGVDRVWNNREEAQDFGKFADQVLWKGINEHRLIFLGTSFVDKPLLNMLGEYKGKQQHFAIIKSDPELAKRVSQLGICPVLVPTYSMIAAVLEEVYCAALDEEECDRVGMADAKAYWKRLESGPEKRPGKNQNH